MRLLDALVQRDDELSDSEDEGEGGRKDHARHRDPDSVVSPSGRRFGVGVGIMGAAPPGVGSAAAAAAAGGVSIGASAAGSGGPSAHTTVESLVKRKSGGDEDEVMEDGAIDTDQPMRDAEDLTTTPPADMEIANDTPPPGSGATASASNDTAPTKASDETSQKS